MFSMLKKEKDKKPSTSKVKKAAKAYEKLGSQVSKSIKEAFSLNFKQYLNRVRMEVATTLLRESTFTIKDISLKSGYKTNSHFFRVFHNFYDESPTEYRKRVVKKP